MNNSLKWLLNDIIGYAAEGNEIIAKTPTIILSARRIGSLVSWIVIYKKLRFHLIGEIGEVDMVFHSVINFINDVDKGINDADNS